MKFIYFGDGPGPISLRDVSGMLRMIGFEIYDSGRDSDYGGKAWYLDIRKLEEKAE